MTAKSKKNEPLREAKVVRTPDEEFENNSDVEFIDDDTMMLPNDGEIMAPEEDEETKEQITEDEMMFKGNEALVQAVFEWMDNEIADCDSIEAAIGISEKYKVTVEQALIALNVCQKVFSAKRVTFQNIHDTVNSESD